MQLHRATAGAGARHIGLSHGLGADGAPGAPAVLPDARAAGLEDAGWGVRRLPGIHHDRQLEDPDRVLQATEDVR
ncbi:hypothetical protein ITJ44_07295 [Clavibacter sp. VKM Ac-2873]|uniref:hypothetical protein n=1 Tax=Clavibacter sp. VKM Ac-2873 TaxID=2783813 RepID=UPI00188DAC44|nr:hypothetical protein [Clavibacter sp. VKM Ac-2873]MBF4617877.1 hypothetical protein [Clavibacter sp. VKM Ac-2873]